MDTDTIAEIIHHWASDQPLLINALANYFTSEQAAAHVTLKHRGPKEDCGWLMCKEPFDRTNFIRIANGGKE